MRLLIQRVNYSKLKVDNKPYSQIKKGLLVLVGISKNTDIKKIDKITNRLLKMRLWEGEKKGFDKSVTDIKGELMIVSQFTLYGNCKQSNKPDFRKSENYQKAEKIYNLFLKTLKEKTNLKIATGVFGAQMKIELENDGPITIIYDED